MTTMYATPEQTAQQSRLNAIHEDMRLNNLARMRRHDEAKQAARHMIEGPCLHCANGELLFHENHANYRRAN